MFQIDQWALYLLENKKFSNTKKELLAVRDQASVNKNTDIQYNKKYRQIPSEATRTDTW